MADNEQEVFILTTDTLHGYEGEVVRFPDPVYACCKEEQIKKGMKGANDYMRTLAREVGANAVIGVRYQYDWLAQHWYVSATGTPVFLDPPFVDPDEYMKNLKEDELA